MKNALRKPLRKAPIDPLIDSLYKAVDAYVKAHGGSIIVIGGISVVEWPNENPGVFHISVKCLGRKPKFKQP